jgi:hypothetical protein
MAEKVTPYQEVFISSNSEKMGSSLEDTNVTQRVYALLVQIPSGRITSYKCLSDALNSSPRAIGGALRNNPFAPEVVSFPPSRPLLYRYRLYSEFLLFKALKMEDAC